MMQWLVQASYNESDALAVGIVILVVVNIDEVYENKTHGH
jgi:hypothetical protein